MLDVERNDVHGGRMEGADVTVARAVDFGANDVTYFTRTHLGHVLNVGELPWWRAPGIENLFSNG